MMKSLILRHIVVLIVLSVLFPAVSQAQLDEPPPIPSDVSGDRRTDLSSRRAALIGQLNDLNARILVHDGKYGRVPASNKALVEEASNAFIQLRGEAASYSTRVKAFGMAVERAVEESKAQSKKILIGLKDDPDPSPDDLAHALTGKALLAGMRGDEEAAISYYRAALKYRPNDRSIRIALGHAMHSRDKDKGLTVVNPKAEFIFDALQYGQGDWEASITYVEDILVKETETDKGKARAACEALNYIKGLYAYHQYQESKELEKIMAAMNDLSGLEELVALSPGAASTYLRQGFKQLEAGNFEAAISNFKSAHDFGGKSFGIEDIRWYAEGLLDAQQKAGKSK